MKKSEEPVFVEQEFAVSPGVVWSAISDVQEMRQWYFDNIPDFRPEVGFSTRFTVVSGERKFVHLWTVVEAVPEKLLKYNWKYSGYPGNSNIIFSIAPISHGCRLRVEAEILEDFSDDIPEFRRESCLGGWQWFINGRLKDYIENNSEY